jgi:hypothetical protein
VFVSIAGKWIYCVVLVLCQFSKRPEKAGSGSNYIRFHAGIFVVPVPNSRIVHNNFNNLIGQTRNCKRKSWFTCIIMFLFHKVFRARLASKLAKCTDMELLWKKVKIVVPYCRYETTQNREEMICCRSEECLSKSPRVAKLLDPDIVQVLLLSREFDDQTHSSPTAANCRWVNSQLV